MADMMLNTVAIEEHTLLWMTGQVYMDGDWVEELMPTKVRARDVDGNLQTTHATVITYTPPDGIKSQVTVVGSTPAVAALLECEDEA